MVCQDLCSNRNTRSFLSRFDKFLSCSIVLEIYVFGIVFNIEVNEGTKRGSKRCSFTFFDVFLIFSQNVRNWIDNFFFQLREIRITFNCIPRASITKIKIRSIRFKALETALEF